MSDQVICKHRKEYGHTCPECPYQVKNSNFVGRACGHRPTPGSHGTTCNNWDPQFVVHRYNNIKKQASALWLLNYQMFSSYIFITMWKKGQNVWLSRRVILTRWCSFSDHVIAGPPSFRIRRCRTVLHISQLDSLLSKGHLVMFQSIFTSRSTGLCVRVCSE